jgi:hypothetical protein
VVDEFLKLNLVGTPIGVRDFGDGVTSGVKPLHGRQQRRRLLGRGQQLDLHRQVHGLV